MTVKTNPRTSAGLVLSRALAAARYREGLNETTA
jgi:hypothetical protein